ncbi:hypothetical protein GCM10023081_07280 [Arthrobacter ginkgonis]|uniref:Uncharacterized protein n=1 Tax=Arthrobacter ginkgonis TaxID=1630594 RepID=A0ABP7BY39_9MICC
MADDFFASLLPGDRIVVRYRLGKDSSAPGGPALTDALGEFAGLQEGTVTGEGTVSGESSAARDGAGIREAAVAVRTRSGIVLIALSSVTHAKRVPPPPARRGPRRPDAE